MFLSSNSLKQSNPSWSIVLDTQHMIPLFVMGHGPWTTPFEAVKSTNSVKSSHHKLDQRYSKECC